MPKNRKRNSQKGAKSISIRTKFKIGGRKSGISAIQMSDEELAAKLKTVRKRDRNKLRRVWEARRSAMSEETGPCSE
jgi:hypothetical protein